MTDYDSIKYERTFLNQVIVRFDFLQFAPTEQIFTEETEKNILSHFPKKGMEQIIRFNAINVVFDPSNNVAQNAHGRNQDGISREYGSPNQKNKFILSNKFLVIDITDYSDFECLQQWLQEIVRPFFSKIKLTVGRAGIRYINILKPDEVRIRKNFFTPEIAATINTKTFKGNRDIALARTMQITEYKVGGMRLNFRYGLFNPQYPNPLLDTSFALDYDCYTDESIEEADGLLQCVVKGHDAIQMVFESSITDALRKVMHNG